MSHPGSLVLGQAEPIDLSRGEPPEPVPSYFIDPEEHVVPIVRREVLAFDGRASGTTQRITLASAVDVSAWVSGAFVTILHAKNAWLTAGGGNTSGQAVFLVENVAVDPTEPDVMYVDESRMVASSSTITATTTAPRLDQAAFVPPFGPSARVSVRFTQGAAAAASAQTLAVSIYLVGRIR